MRLDSSETHSSRLSSDAKKLKSPRDRGGARTLSLYLLAYKKWGSKPCLFLMQRCSETPRRQYRIVVKNRSPDSLFFGRLRCSLRREGYLIPIERLKLFGCLGVLPRRLPQRIDDIGNDHHDDATDNQYREPNGIAARRNLSGRDEAQHKGQQGPQNPKPAMIQIRKLPLPIRNGRCSFGILYRRTMAEANINRYMIRYNSTVN